MCIEFPALLAAWPSTLIDEAAGKTLHLVLEHHDVPGHVLVLLVGVVLGDERLPISFSLTSVYALKYVVFTARSIRYRWWVEYRPASPIELRTRPSRKKWDRRMYP